MASMNVSIPAPMRDWVEDRVRSGDYADASDYIEDLIRHDRERHAALVEALIEGEKSGISNRTVAEIVADAKAALRSGAS